MPIVCAKWNKNVEQKVIFVVMAQIYHLLTQKAYN